MDKIKEIIEIAEGLFKGKLVSQVWDVIYISNPPTENKANTRSFNPYESNADCFLVLEALVRLEGEVWLSESAAVLAGRESPFYCHRNNKENLKALICEAYLSAKGEK